MQIQFLVPGLLWPAAQTRSPCAGLALPALERLLALGDARLDAGCAADAALLERFSLPASAAIAPLRRRGEDGADEAAGGHWLCVDPVGLHFAREHLLLMDASELDIQPAESDSLIDGLNRSFAEVGRFSAGSPRRWYLRLEDAPGAEFAPLANVVSRPVAHYMPRGEHAHDWHRLINELQVWLHAHPVNQAREADGRQTINSLWPWGAGTSPAGIRAPAAVVACDSVLARGLARSAGAEAMSLRDFDLARARHDTLVVLEQAHQPALYMDLDRWRDALASIERDWLTPALSALRAGRLERIEILAAGDRASLRVRVDRPRIWPFWRRPQPLSHFIETQP